MDTSYTTSGSMRYPLEVKCRHVPFSSLGLGDNIVNQPKWKTFYLSPPALANIGPGNSSESTIVANPNPASTAWLEWFTTVSENYPAIELMDNPGFSSTTTTDAVPAQPNMVCRISF